jgi:pimeloyl-ACP methyl ester carboxylesterase
VKTPRKSYFDRRLHFYFFSLLSSCAMAKKIYALLVGINDYPAGVGSLAGCVNDVKSFADFLKDTYGKKYDLRLEILLNKDASKANIVKQFKSHLAKAQKEDTVFFHYSGHGSREYTAEEFWQYEPSKQHQTIVCQDSRTAGNWDLADKELALLLHLAGQNLPHFAVSMDCCHSGSATRSAEEVRLANARLTNGRDAADRRPLETFMDGYYQKNGLSIPKTPHLLMAACTHKEKAWETHEKRGLFSTSLLKVLQDTGGNITYSELYLRTRADIRRHSGEQNPQFEPMEGFDARAYFLTGEKSEAFSKYYPMYNHFGKWKIDIGATGGFPTSPDKKLEFAIYPAGAKRVAENRLGLATSEQVLPRETFLKPNFSIGNLNQKFDAELISFPNPLVFLHVQAQTEEAQAGAASFIEKFKERNSFLATLVEDFSTANYHILAKKEEAYCQYELYHTESQILIQGLRVQGEDFSIAMIDLMLENLEKVARSEMLLRLDNPNPKLNPDDFEVEFFRELENGEIEPFATPELAIIYDEQEVEKVDYEDDEGNEKTAFVIPYPCKIRVRNKSEQPLFLAVLNLGYDLSISTLYNEEITEKSDWVTVFDNEEFSLAIPYGILDNTAENYRFVVSTERMDSFHWEQLGIDKFGQVVGLSRPAIPKRQVKKFSQDWFVKDLRLKISKKQADLTSDVQLGDLLLKRSDKVATQIVLADSVASYLDKNPVETTLLENISNLASKVGLNLLKFGKNRSVLELEQIEPTATQDPNQPQNIELEVAVSPEEQVIASAFDGEFIVPLEVAEPIEGKARLAVSLPLSEESPKSRGLGRSLKMCFFKVALKKRHQQRLFWVEKKADKTFALHTQHFKEQVEKAQNILLLVHGFLGSAQEVVADLLDQNLDQNYDLILAYDYEDLNTPFETNARDLAYRLKMAGLDEKAALQGRKITVLAHSIGGLLARYWIEKDELAGRNLVKKLILLGTPQEGTAFSQVVQYRNVTTLLLGLSLNFLPAAAPALTGLMAVLDQSKHATQTLEQLRPHSDFLRELALLPDPAVEYIVFYGNVETIPTQSPQNLTPKLLHKLQAQVGEVFYKGQGHDVFISQASATAVDKNRNPAPTFVEVPAFHLEFLKNEQTIEKLKLYL